MMFLLLIHEPYVEVEYLNGRRQRQKAIFMADCLKDIDLNELYPDGVADIGAQEIRQMNILLA